MADFSRHFQASKRATSPREVRGLFISVYPSLERNLTVPTTAESEKLKSKLWDILKANPAGMSTKDAANAALGAAKDEDEQRRRTQRAYFQLKNLANEKHVVMKGKGFWVVKGDRPSPEVNDLPANTNGKRKYNRRTYSHSNVPANGVDLKAIIIKQIRDALALLEAM